MIKKLVNKLHRHYYKEEYRELEEALMHIGPLTCRFRKYKWVKELHVAIVNILYL